MSFCYVRPEISFPYWTLRVDPLGMAGVILEKKEEKLNHYFLVWAIKRRVYNMVNHILPITLAKHLDEILSVREI